MSTFALQVDTRGLSARLGRVVAGCEAAVRPAAQAGAQVFYDRVRQLVPTGKQGHWFHGTSYRLNGTKYWFDAGALRNAIYQAYSADHSGPGRATYHIAWNHKKAPYGFMVEFGTSRAPAHPFLRPARAQAKRARDAMAQRYQLELRERGVTA